MKSSWKVDFYDVTTDFIRKVYKKITPATKEACIPQWTSSLSEPTSFEYIHYGHFWWFLSKNWGNVFVSNGYNFDQIFESLPSKIKNAADHKVNGGKLAWIATTIESDHKNGFAQA